MIVDNAEKQKDNTQTTPGTASKDALQSKTEGISGGKAQEISQKTTETYTREQLLNFRSDGLAEQGKKHTATVKILQGKVDELSEVQDDREALRSQISELSSKDPEVFNLAKKEQELRGRETELKRGIKEHAIDVQTAKEFKREVVIQKVVEEYEGGDFVKLKGLCESFNVSSEDQIRTAADTLWGKKFNPPASEPPPPAPPAISGVTSGGESAPESARGKMRAGWDELHKK